MKNNYPITSQSYKIHVDASYDEKNKIGIPQIISLFNLLFLQNTDTYSN